MKRKILLFISILILISLFIVYGAISPCIFTQHSLIIEIPLSILVSISLFIWIKKSNNLKTLSLRMVGSIFISISMYILMSLILTSCYFPKSLLNSHKTVVGTETDENNHANLILKESPHDTQWCF